MESVRTEYSPFLIENLTSHLLLKPLIIRWTLKKILNIFENQGWSTHS